MKKKKFVSLVLLSLVCILPVLCILMAHHISLCSTLGKMEEGTFGEKAGIIALKDNNAQAKNDLYKTLKENKLNCALYLDDKQNIENTVRYMAFTKKYVDLPMVSGRFLMESDLRAGNMVAVVGKKVSGVYLKQGKEYIRINEQEYRVIGKMGYEEDTAFDNYIFVNLFACENSELTIYTVDFFDRDNGWDILEKYAEKNDKAEILSETESFVDNINTEIDSGGYFVALLICYILCIVLISYQWLMFQRREMAIRRLVGATQGQIVMKVISDYIVYMIVAFVIGYLYSKFFYPSYQTSFFKGYFISMTVLMVFMLINILKVKKDRIDEVIKK